MGAMTFGDEADEPATHAMLDRFVEAGGTFIDTADVYAKGRSEEFIGRWLASRSHSHLVIGTKARFSTSSDPKDRGAGRRHLGRAIEASLKRLGLDAVDLYQIHAWDPEVPAEETLGTLDDLVRQGKVRYVGVSNFTGWQLQRFILTARHRALAPVVSLQAQYNLLGRHIELELLPQLLEEGLGLLPWSPLGGGWLSGKYRRDDRPTGASRLGEDPGRGIEAYDPRNTDRTWQIIDEVKSIAEAHGASPAQAALNWLRRRPGVSSVILGARTVEQLDDNLASLAWELTDDETDRLTKISAPGIPDYPYGFIENNAGSGSWQNLGSRSRPFPTGN